MLFSNSH